MQSLELVCRTRLQRLCAIARIASAQAQEYHLSEPFGSAAHTTHRRIARVLTLQQWVVCRDPRPPFAIERRSGEDIRLPRRSWRRLRLVRTDRAGGPCRIRLHKLVGCDIRARLSVRVPAAPAEGFRPLRATHLLPGTWRLRSFRAADWAVPGLTRAASGHHQRRWPDPGTGRKISRRKNACLFQRT